MTVIDFLRIEWSAPGEPVIEPPRLSPVIADPSFLFPEETPTGEWELFAHSAWGVHRYSSPDGLSWHDRGLIVRNAMRPFVRRLDGTYLLYLEKYPPLALPMTALPFRRRWRSTISVCSSDDLASWSRPRTLVEPSLEWMRDASLGDSVSNPCIVSAPGPGGEDAGREWRLYFSASLAWIDDCGFCEPRRIAVARGRSPTGPFVPDPEPIIDPSRDGAPDELGAGSMKVMRMDDGWIGLQNRIYRDPGGVSRSAIFVLRSGDGVAWTSARADPLVAPGAGWTSSHVYACDCRRRAEDGRWYLYFNARDGWRISEGKERIGRIVGLERRGRSAVY